MKENIKYRQLQLKDLKEVYEVALEAWNYTYKDIYTSSKIKDYVDKYYSNEIMQEQIAGVESGKIFFCTAVLDECIVGFCNIVMRDNNEAELWRIYLKPSCIGKGIGKKLLFLGEEFLQSKGIGKIFCYAHKDNKLGHEFYLRYGFELTAQKSNKLFENECDYFFEKKLT